MTNPFSKIAVIFLGLIAVMQLARFLMAWPVTVNNVVIAVSASGVASLVAGGLAVMVWREARS